MPRAGGARRRMEGRRLRRVVPPPGRRAGLVLDARARVARRRQRVGQRHARRGADRLPAAVPCCSRARSSGPTSSPMPWPGRQRGTAGRGAAGAAVGRDIGFVGGRQPAVAAAPEAGVDARATDDGGFELTGTKRAVQDVDASSWLLVTCTSPVGPVQVVVAADAAWRHRHRAGLARPQSAVRRGPLRRRLRRRRRRSSAPPATTRCSSVSLPWRARSSPPRPSGRWTTTSAMTVQYAKDRIAFGRPIGSFQARQAPVRRHQPGARDEQGGGARRSAHVGADDDYGPEAASIAKAFVGDAGIELVQTCFQVFGGIGYTWEHDQHLYLRRITDRRRAVRRPGVASRAPVPAGRDLRKGTT